MTRRSIAAGMAALLLGTTANAASISYFGEISRENNALMFSRIAGKKIDKLVIDSPGGSVEAGIALGNWVFDNGIDVVVYKYCLSSCANYVFTAARNKIILPTAVVAWHGNYHHLHATGLWRDDVTARVQDGQDEASATREVREQVDRLVAMEKVFFKKIGVDEYLCRVGKHPPYEVENYFFLSGPDMQRYGVANVKLPPSYEDTPVGGAPWSIRYLKLE